MKWIFEPPGTRKQVMAGYILGLILTLILGALTL